MITIYGSDWCCDCRRTKQLLEKLKVKFEYLDLAKDETLVAKAQEISGRMQIPVVVYPDGSHQVEPTNTEIESKLKELKIISSI